MAVVPWHSEVYTSDRSNGCHGRTSRHSRVIRSALVFVKTQLCTLAIALTLFNSVRLPREAEKYGAVPYLVVYSMWLVAAALPATLLQLAAGQLSQQDPVGVWRAVPILRGRDLLKYWSVPYLVVYSMWMVAAAMPATLLQLSVGQLSRQDQVGVWRAVPILRGGDFYKYGAVPYLMVYSMWLVAAALPATLLQLAVGQLSQQDPVRVWRAVAILRGVGHLKVMTSYICCVYIMLHVALSTAYFVWIGKGSFPLKDCTKLQITPHGYENKMNASECFHSTFLAPFTIYPQYLGIMAIIIFILWFFVPILLYRLRKSLKASLSVLAPVTLIIALVLCTFLADGAVLSSVLQSCEQWIALSQPYIWHSAMVQALLSTQVAGGYLISAGGTVYRHSDVRWTSVMIIIVNLLAAWIWVFLWESIGGRGPKDTSFISVMVSIYQSSVSEQRRKEWPMLAFVMLSLSGIITVLVLLFPVFSKLCRFFNDHWRLTAAASSALGTTITIAMLTRGLEVATMVDELIVPVLAAFTTAVEIVGFVFIYGWYYLMIDIEFLTGTKLPSIWIAAWWMSPILIVGVTGWWLRTILKAAWGQGITLWPLVGVFVGILVVVVVMAAVAVAKEEQFNLFTKIASSFRPSRLWGPEEPMARYIWMSQRCTPEHSSESNNYTQEVPKLYEKPYAENCVKPIEPYTIEKRSHKNYYLPEDDTVFKENGTGVTKHSVPKSKKRKKEEEKFRSPNVCIAKTELGGPLSCNCNRHFTLNVPDLRKLEKTTSL